MQHDKMLHDFLIFNFFFGLYMQLCIV